MQWQGIPDFGSKYFAICFFSKWQTIPHPHPFYPTLTSLDCAVNNKIEAFFCYSEYRPGAATLQGSPIHHYLVPAHQQHQMAALTAAAATAATATVGQYGPFSPSVAPPPAHQSPRHVQYAAHPLPAHMHPVLHTSTLPAFHAGQIHPHPHYAASSASYLNSAAPPPTGVYATYQISPIKPRQYQYFA